MKIKQLIEENKNLGIIEWKPSETGYVYFICENDGKIIYIGTTMNITARIKTHYSNIEFYNKPFFYFLAPMKECLKVELELIIKVKPKFNIQGIPNQGTTKQRYCSPDCIKTTKKKISKALATKRKKHIVTAMEKYGINQTELAKLMGVSRQRISQIINGENFLHIDTIMKLEKVLKFKLNISARSSIDKAGRPHNHWIHSDTTCR